METLKINNLGSAPRSSEGLYKAVTSKGSALFTPSESPLPPPSSGTSFWRYLFVFLILVFLGLTLVLFLLKPANKDIKNLYDPITSLFNFDAKDVKGSASVASVSKKNNNAAVNKLDKLLTAKPVINNIDNTENKKINLQAQALEAPKKYKRLPVIPESDDATSSVQMKPTSKTGFCYIGEDRGFRSCIEVGEGDVCMSGDIFPSQSICINPNLRE
jgi:hypothetical protein